MYFGGLTLFHAMVEQECKIKNNFEFILFFKQRHCVSNGVESQSGLESDFGVAFLPLFLPLFFPSS